MEGLCTKHLSFSLLAKNLKKRSFEARSLHILGISWGKISYPVLHPLLGKCFCQLGGGAQDKDKQAQGSETGYRPWVIPKSSFYQLVTEKTCFLG